MACRANAACRYCRLKTGVRETKGRLSRHAAFRLGRAAAGNITARQLAIGPPALTRRTGNYTHWSKDPSGPPR